VPATIDSRDWKFAQIYCGALARGDRACGDYVKQAFHSLLFDTTQKARQATRNIAGADGKQVLMLEASRFTADTLAETIAWYKRMGARFISLDEALRDPIFTTLTHDGQVQAIAVFREVKNLQWGDDDD
jgi:hypothetical protein